MSEIFTPPRPPQPADDRPRLVLDTNTVLALWMFRDPALDALRAWIEAGGCELHAREDTLEELRRVLAYRQFGLDAAAQLAIAQHYQAHLAPAASPVEPSLADRLARLPRCRDDDDQKFLALACERAAHLLITRDRALLRLARTTRSRLGLDIVGGEVLSAELVTGAPQTPPTGRPGIAKRA